MEGIIAAFFIGGAFCAAFQVIQDYTGSIPPQDSCWWASARARWLRRWASWPRWARSPARASGILVIGFGEAVYLAIQGLLQGDWTGVLTNLVVLVVFCCMGVVAGAGHLARAKGRKASLQQAPGGETAAE